MRFKEQKLMDWVMYPSFRGAAVTNYESWYTNIDATANQKGIWVVFSTEKVI